MSPLELVSPIVTPRIAAFIRARRKELKITQVDLAKALRISQSALSKIESGQMGIFSVPLA